MAGFTTANDSSVNPESPEAILSSVCPIAGITTANNSSVNPESPEAILSSICYQWQESPQQTNLQSPIPLRGD